MKQNHSFTIEPMINAGEAVVLRCVSHCPLDCIVSINGVESVSFFSIPDGSVPERPFATPVLITHFIADADLIDHVPYPRILGRRDVAR